MRASTYTADGEERYARPRQTEEAYAQGADLLNDVWVRGRKQRVVRGVGIGKKPWEVALRRKLD